MLQLKNLLDIRQRLLIFGEHKKAKGVIVSSRVGTPPLLREPPSPFLGTPSFWRKLKTLAPSFWELSILVYINYINHVKMKVLPFVLYQFNWEYHYHYFLYFQAQLWIYYRHLLWLDIAVHVFSYLIWKRNEHETFRITLLLNLMCVLNLK